MKIAVIAGENEKAEFLENGINTSNEVLWLNSPESVPADCNCCIDLLFNNESSRVQLLSSLTIPLIVVNAVAITSAGLPGNFIRINGWSIFIKRHTIEACCLQESMKGKVEEVFACFNKKINWTPDIPGFVAARIISSIINEAYLALGEKVSTKAEIDTAMKLGTNYPYGPFEWSSKIGLTYVYQLLKAMAEENERYKPANELTKEVSAL